MSERVYLCGLCDTHHLPGECPEGAPAPPPVDNCPWCLKDGRGEHPLRQYFDSDVKRMVWACAFCRWGHVKARRRGNRAGRKRAVKR